MTTGEVQAALFHTQTWPAGLLQKPEPSLFIKRIFLLTQNPARHAPVNPVKRATIWAQTAAQSKNK